MTRYGNLVNPMKTPQSESARSDQAKNNAGGYVFEVGPWKQLDRFLVLGQVGATYYASERAVVKDNANVIQTCLKEDGQRVVKRIVEISDAGRAPKNDPAIFALALAASSEDVAVRHAALEALPAVCRIGTHLFHFAGDVTKFRSWGRGLRSAVANWYTSRSEQDLAMQAIKYQQRDGWSHRDLLRLSHPKAKTPEQNAVFSWMVDKAVETEALPETIQAFIELHAATDVKDVVRIIRDHRLPREAVPTQWLNRKEVWEALFPQMGITALIRNLGKMTAIGLIAPLSDASKIIVSRLDDGDILRRARVHPMQLLLANGIYGQGHGDKGKLRWVPDQRVRDALDDGFYKAFKNVEPTGKNTMLALDVSGSMTSGLIAGAPGITPRVASAALAMVTARTEPNWLMVGFTAAPMGYGGKWGGGDASLTPIDVSKNERMDSLCAKIARMRMGGTDCALPILHAHKNKMTVDTFTVYTDNETWAGSVHPFQALKAYRREINPSAKLIVVGMTATNFTIADPSDAGMLDVVGFDSHAPSLMADFSRGEV